MLLSSPITAVLGDGFLDNSVDKWIVAALTATGLFVVLLLAKRLIVARFGKIAERTTNRFDDMIVATLAKTRTWVLIAFSLIIGLDQLTLSARIESHLAPTAKLILLWQIALWGSAAITFWIKHHLDSRAAAGERASVAMVTAMGVGANVLLWVLVIITAFHSVLSIDVTPWIAGLGVSGIAVALAVQNILGDLLAALSIVFDKPFDVGDTIGVDNITGVVEHIGLKTTRIRAQSGEQIIIGNGDLVKSRMRNFRRQYQRRVVFPIDLAFDTPPDALAALTSEFEKIVSAQTPVKFDRCHVSLIAESGLRIETVYYVLDPEYRKYMDVQQAINLGILNLLRERGLALATTSSVSILRRPQ
jgi:small-conductance mechanosensitive channel